MRRLLVVALLVAGCGASPAPTGITLTAAQGALTTDQELLQRVTTLEARVDALEIQLHASAPPSATPAPSPSPTPSPTPVPTPTPTASPTATPVPSLPPSQAPPIVSGPIAFSHDGQVIENVVIDSLPGQAMTHDGQFAVPGTTAIYGKGFKDCTIRNVTLRGRQWGVLLVDMNNVTIENVTIQDVNRTGIDVFGGFTGRISNVTIQRIGMLRTSADIAGNSGLGNNAYGIKFERASTSGISGASSNIPTDWTVDHATIEDSPLWMGVNAHEAANLTVQDSTVRRAPRAYFFVGTITNLKLLRDSALEPVTRTNGSTDIESMLYGSVKGGAITDSRIGTGYPNPVNYNGTSTGVTVSGTVRVP